MRGFRRITIAAACSIALVLFGISGIGCNNQKAGSPDLVAKPMSGGHGDHAGHGNAGHDQNAASHKAAGHAGHGEHAKRKPSGHDHSAHQAAGGGHKMAPSDAPKISQKNCPVMGEEIDPEVSIMHGGRKVYFCCEDCIPKFKKDPAKFMAKLDPGK